jgi:hypothetical protein
MEWQIDHSPFPRDTVFRSVDVPAALDKSGVDL